MNPFRCHYHPEIEAVTKCEKCGKYLCLECKTVYHQVVGDEDAMGSIRQELCPECRDRTVGMNLVIFFIFLIIFLIAASIMIENFNRATNDNPLFP